MFDNYRVFRVDSIIATLNFTFKSQFHIVKQKKLVNNRRVIVCQAIIQIPPNKKNKIAV